MILRKLGDMNQPLHSVSNVYKSSKGDELGYLALHYVAFGVLPGDFRPGILLGLLQTQGHSFPFPVHIQDHHLNLIPYGDNFGRMVNVAPG
ncbi:MAG: hypothetical protein DDT18_00987 [Actinobacteria bacterium]|nr:hypothetical protein [Actinomycetota bacterium]